MWIENGLTRVSWKIGENTLIQSPKQMQHAKLNLHSSSMQCVMGIGTQRQTKTISMLAAPFSVITFNCRIICVQQRGTRVSSSMQHAHVTTFIPIIRTAVVITYNFTYTKQRVHGCRELPSGVWEGTQCLRLYCAVCSRFSIGMTHMQSQETLRQYSNFKCIQMALVA